MFYNALFNTYLVLLFVSTAVVLAAYDFERTTKQMATHLIRAAKQSERCDDTHQVQHRVQVYIYQYIDTQFW